MKKYLYLPLVLVVIFLASWGVAGHQTVATIATNHLTPKSKEMVKALLGDTTLADIASWADQVLRDPAYKATAPQHYLNLPLGLSYPDFQKSVIVKSEYNVYQGLTSNLMILKDAKSTREQKAVALKFVVHFVGDLHQPMHISRKEDKGGNDIQVQYDGKGTNLHSLWDSKLINTEGNGFEQMAVDYDTATLQQIKQWQSDDILKWLWESYEISSKLYAEVEQNNKLDDAYYKAHIPIIHERIEQAGIRLAGLLNQVSVDANIAPPVVKELSGSVAYSPVALNDVANHIGERVNAKGTVADYKELDNMLLVNIGAPYPNSPLTLVFKGKAVTLGQRLIKAKDVKIFILGTLTSYKGKTQIEITDANQLLLAP